MSFHKPRFIPRFIPLDGLPEHYWDIYGVRVWGEDILTALELDGTLQQIIDEAAAADEVPGMYEDRAYELAERLAPVIAEREAFAMRRGRRHLFTI